MVEVGVYALIFFDYDTVDASSINARHEKEGSAVADKPARRAASRRTGSKQIRWTLSVINLRPS